MSLNKKLFFLISSFVIIIIYTLYSFDYKKNLGNNHSSIKKIEKVIKIKNKEIAINFEITKKKNIVSLSGEFKDNKQLQYLTNYLNINKKDNITFNHQITFEQKNIEEVKELVSPLKDYFTDGSKIILKNKELFIEGKLN